MYLIVEVYNRELCSVHTVPTPRQAVDTANVILKKHCNTIDYAEAYETAEASAISSGDLEQDDIKFSSQDSMDAWCNFRGGHFDIFVTRLDAAEKGADNNA